MSIAASKYPQFLGLGPTSPILYRLRIGGASTIDAEKRGFRINAIFGFVELAAQRLFLLTGVSHAFSIHSRSFSPSIEGSSSRFTIDRPSRILGLDCLGNLEFLDQPCGG